MPHRSAVAVAPVRGAGKGGDATSINGNRYPVTWGFIVLGLI